MSEDKGKLAELREMYFADRRWADLVDVLRREIQVTPDRDERIGLYEELGSIALQQLNDADLAFDSFQTVMDVQNWPAQERASTYRQVLDIDPAHDGAFEALAAMLRERGDEEALEELAGAYIDRADALAHDPALFAEARLQAAKMFHEELGDAVAAAVTLASSLTPATWRRVVDEAELMAHRAGEWDELITQAQRLAEQLGEGPEASELHKRIGLWLMPLDENTQAGQHLRIASRHRADDAELEGALEKLYRNTNRFDELVTIARTRFLQSEQGDRQAETNYVDTLKSAAANDPEPRRRAAYYAELGTYYDEARDNRVTAVTYWEQALNEEPETVEAAGPLADHYMAQNRWEKAAPALEAVIKAAEGRRTVIEPQILNHHYLQYGEVLDRLGNEKLALHAYRQAYEIDRNNPKTLERLGLLLYEAGQYDQAFHAMIALVDRHEKTTPPDVLADVLRKAADIRRRAGDERVARGLLERVLRVKPRDTGALRAIADIGEATGDVEQAMAARRSMVEAETDPMARFQLLVELGDAWREHGREMEAARSYVAALDIDEDSVAVLRKLLESFRNMGRWSESIGVLERLRNFERDRQKRANLSYTMGVIARDQLMHPQRAVSYFDAALDEYPELLKAFEAIDRILTEAKAWKELERAYRRMLHRVMENALELGQARQDEVSFLLWTSLGEVYRSRLKHPEAAIQAFETAQKLRPDDDRVRNILAELYTLAAPDRSGAILQLRNVLERDPNRADSYHSLFDAYLARREFDRAWCVAGVLCQLGKANQDEEELYRRYLGWNLKLCDSHFLPEIFDRIYPSTQNRVVNGVLANLAVGMRGFFAYPHKEFGVDPKRDVMDAEERRLVVSKMFTYVARTLAVTPQPPLFVRRDHPLGVRILNTDPPAVLFGEDILQTYGDDRRMAFRLGKLLTWMRPEHYLAAIGNSPGQLALLFATTMDWALGRRATTGREGERLLKQIKGLPSPIQMQLQSLMRIYLERTREVPDMNQWMNAAEKATSRCALILCNDLQIAVTAVETEPPALTTASTRERVNDLLEFAASEKYSDIRRELGLAIG